jgi:hypothetical protein
MGAEKGICVICPWARLSFSLSLSVDAERLSKFCFTTAVFNAIKMNGERREGFADGWRCIWEVTHTPLLCFLANGVEQPALLPLELRAGKCPARHEALLLLGEVWESLFLLPH